MSKPGFRNIPKSCLVTGGSGFVGQRLVEMLVERGCERVVSFDIAPAPKGCLESSKIEYLQGDLSDYKTVLNASKNVEAIFHIAALVGPYHPQDAYRRVNYDGTMNVLNAAKELGIKRIVMSSSPSTRFPYPDPNICNKTEDELYVMNGNQDYAPVFLQPYAETKAQGEKVIRDACGTKNSDLLTIAVAPHQVYGPRDGLFLPSLLSVAGADKLYIFGNGLNRISFCYVDNYCHGLILGYEALYENSPALGKFYVITDGDGQLFWKVLDEAIISMGFASIWSKMKLPGWFMLGLGYIVLYLSKFLSLVTRVPEHRINYYLKLNPFAVKMLLIDREFNISAARRDLKYEPLVTFEEGWNITIKWFQDNWLPHYLKSK